MALIKCTECGQMVSDKAEMCPNCGCPIEKKIYCEECGQELTANDRKCPNCGCPTKSQQSSFSEQKVHLKVSLGNDDYRDNHQQRYNEIPSPSMMECVSSFFKQLINFTGRARRAEVWYVLLFNFLVVGIPLTLVFIVSMIGLASSIVSEGPSQTSSFTPFVYLLFLYFPYLLVCFIGNISLGVRRLHDIGISGWFFLISFIPYIGWIFQLVTALINSKKEVNQWGESPKFKPIKQ